MILGELPAAASAAASSATEPAVPECAAIPIPAKWWSPIMATVIRIEEDVEINRPVDMGIA